VRVEEAAEMLGLGRSTVFELLKDGSLASIKVGKRRLIPIHEIAAFIGRLASPKKG
jgi:excisionase family DNA binding protein